MKVSLRSAAALAILVTALAAHAAPTLTLQPLTVVRPLSGAATFSVIGTLTSTVGDTITNFTETGQLIGPVGSTPRFNSGIFFSQIQAGLNATGSYTGPLFTYTFSSVDPLGIYTHQTGGVTFLTSTGTSNSVNPVVTLVGTPTPEPSAFAALGLGAAAVLRRRKRA